MNILVIAPTPFFADRGCHVRIYEQVKALEGLGHQIVVATYHNGQDVPGVTVYRIPRLLFWYRKLEAGPSWWKPLLDVLLLLTCLALCRKREFDLILAHLHEGALIGWTCNRLLRLRIPLFFDYQGSLSGEVLDHGFLPRHGAIRSIIGALERRLDCLADRVICSSQAGASDLIERSGIHPERVLTVEDTLDPSMFRPGTADPQLKSRLGIPSGVTVIGYLGLLNEYQGIDLLLQAAESMLREEPDVHFLIMGYPNEARYQAMARGLGIEAAVSFSGRVPYLESPRHLNQVDIAVSPKVSRAEANGKLYAYMASGLPCVAFDTRVNREIMSDAGIYARPGDPVDLATQMRRLLVDPELRRDLGRRLRHRAVQAWEVRRRHLVDCLPDGSLSVPAGRKEQRPRESLGG